MKQHHLWSVALIVAGVVGVATGVAWAQYPIVDLVAGKVVQKYQAATCEQLWETRGKHGPKEQELVQFLRTNPGAKQEFFNKVAAPVVSKMFDCGMIP